MAPLVYDGKAIEPVVLAHKVTFLGPTHATFGSDVWLMLRVCYVQDQLKVEKQTISHIGTTPLGSITELFRWKDVVYIGHRLDDAVCGRS